MLQSSWGRLNKHFQIGNFKGNHSASVFYTENFKFVINKHYNRWAVEGDIWKLRVDISRDAILFLSSPQRVLEQVPGECATSMLDAVQLGAK